MAPKAEVIINAVNEGASDEELAVLEGTDDKDFAAEAEEVLGCTDPIAKNYNPKATKDDGSCEYPTFSIDTPEVVYKATPEEYFTIAPEFFGIQTNAGYKRDKSEKEAV